MTLFVAFAFPFLLAGGGAIVAGRKGAWAVFVIEMLILAGASLLLSSSPPTSLTIPDLFWLLIAIAYLAACSYLAGKFIPEPDSKAAH